MEFILSGKLRDKVGSRHAVKSRKNGQIPAVLYGRAIENLHFSVNRRKLDELLRHHEKFLQIKIGDMKPVNVIIQDIQYDAISGEVLHLDVRSVKLDEKISADVSLKIIGSELAPGVQEGGNLEIIIHELTVSCFPDKIPESIEIDVSEMKMDETKTGKDIEPIEGVEVVIDADEILVHMVKAIDVEAETDIEQSLQEIEESEPTVQKQKEPEQEADKEADKDADKGRKGK